MGKEPHTGRTPPTEQYCLRCGRIPPADDPWHRGVGALSRTDNKSYICSHCGTAEAMEDWAGRLLPQKEWLGLRRL